LGTWVSTITVAATLAGTTGFCVVLQAADAEAGRAPQAYYVSPSGSDDNEGTTQAKPWKTSGKVNTAALRPGDSVLLEGGQSFAGNLLITASDSATAFITIGSYGAGPAAIQAGASFGIRLLNCQYIKVRDLILAGSRVKPNGTTTNKEQGLDIFSTAKEGRPWQSIHVEKLAVSGFRDGIVLHTPIGTQGVVGYDDVRVSNCTIKECLFGGFYCWGSKRASGKPWGLPLGPGVFTNCYLGGRTIYDIYNDPNDNPVICLPIQIFNATSFLVEHCTIHDCGQAAQAKGQPGGVGGLVFLECDKSVRRDPALVQRPNRMGGRVDAGRGCAMAGGLRSETTGGATHGRGNPAGPHTFGVEGTAGRQEDHGLPALP